MARTTGGRGRGRGAAAEEPPNEVQAEPRGRGRGRGAGAGRGRGSAGVDPPHEVEAEVPLRRSSREHVPARHRNDLLERIATRPAHARTSRSSDPHPRDRTSPSPSPPPQTAGSIGPAFPDNTENAPPQALRPSPPRPSRSPVPAYNVTVRPSHPVASDTPDRCAYSKTARSLWSLSSWTRDLRFILPRSPLWPGYACTWTESPSTTARAPSRL